MAVANLSFDRRRGLDPCECCLLFAIRVVWDENRQMSLTGRTKEHANEKDIRTLNHPALTFLFTGHLAKGMYSVSHAGRF